MNIPLEWQDRWPHITFSYNERNGLWIGKIRSGAGKYFRVVNGNIDLPSAIWFDDEERGAKIACEYEKKYPHLHFSPGSGYLSVSIGRLYEGRFISGSNVKNNMLRHLEDPDTIQRMEYLETQADLVMGGFYFFCYGHDRAELGTEFSYFHFSCNFCREWGNMYPEQRRAALAETYE